MAHTMGAGEMLRADVQRPVRSDGRPGRNSPPHESVHTGGPDGARLSGGASSCNPLSFFSACVLAVPALAQQLQTRPEVLQLSLKQAVELALAPEGSTRVKLAEEALKQARSQADEARAGAAARLRELRCNIKTKPTT